MQLIGFLDARGRPLTLATDDSPWRCTECRQIPYGESKILSRRLLNPPPPRSENRAAWVICKQKHLLAGMQCEIADLGI